MSRIKRQNVPGCRCGSGFYCRIHLCYSVEKDPYIVGPKQDKPKPVKVKGIDGRSKAKHGNRKRLAYIPQGDI